MANHRVEISNIYIRGRWIEGDKITNEVRSVELVFIVSYPTRNVKDKI